LWFTGLGACMLFGFLFFRPLNEPVYRIIAADGLGYYSYLPAQFIYHDSEFSFSWFDATFNKHYDNHLFEKPTDNFMVAHGNKRIDKYYPGQSLLQLPFFFAAHLCAVWLDFPADGFSMPYQVAMGLAALFYCFIGLWCCSALLEKMFSDRSVALIAPLAVFFGTNLFTYTIYSGCYSHVYSFCFLSFSYYAAYSFFTAEIRKGDWLLVFILCVLIVASLRPLNLLLLTGAFYFYKPFSINRAFPGFGKFSVLLVVLIGLVLIYNFRIIYIQTGKFVLDTYTGERFYFDDLSHVWDNIAGFQYGMLWYTPLIIVALLMMFFVRHTPRLLFLLIPVLAVVFLYSCWWYWSILSRVITDCSVILMILLGYLLSRVKQNRRARLTALVAVFACIPFFQLKAFQLRNSIIDSNYTYAKYYFKHFFTLHKVHTYPVDPSTVKKSQDFFQDFEHATGDGVSSAKAFEGSKSAVLDATHDFAGTATYTVPAFVNDQGFKKVKAAFWLYNEGELNRLSLVFTFNRDSSGIAYIPFYIDDGLRRNRWDFYEFGIDIPPNVKAGDQFTIYLWNPDKEDRAFIDNVKLEFFLTDGSKEITLR